MRPIRPVRAAIARPVRTALLWVIGFSIVAAVLWLALPLFAWHAVEASLRVTSAEGVLLVGLLTLIALLMRAALFVVRQRIAVRMALWVSHTWGREVLSRRLQAGAERAAVDAGQVSLARIHLVLSGPALFAPIDALASGVAVAALLFIHPLLGALTLLLLAILTISGLRLSRSVANALVASDAASADADRAWRSAAANSAVIAAHGMAGGIINNWDNLNRRVIARAFAASQPLARVSRTASVVEAISLPALIFAGVWLNHQGELALGALVAVALLHHRIIAAATVWLAVVPQWVAGHRAFTELQQEFARASELAPAVALAAARVAAAVPRPMSAQRVATR